MTVHIYASRALKKSILHEESVCRDKSFICIAIKKEFVGQSGTVEPLVLWGPWDPRVHRFEY